MITIDDIMNNYICLCGNQMKEYSRYSYICVSCQYLAYYNMCGVSIISDLIRIGTSLRIIYISTDYYDVHLSFRDSNNPPLDFYSNTINLNNLLNNKTFFNDMIDKHLLLC